MTKKFVNGECFAEATQAARTPRQMLDHNKNARASRLFRRATALTRIECFNRATSHTGPFYFLGITCRIITTVVREPPSWKDFGAQALQARLRGAKTCLQCVKSSMAVLGR